jgi:hypothetical protein
MTETICIGDLSIQVTKKDVRMSICLFIRPTGVSP